MDAESVCFGIYCFPGFKHDEIPSRTVHGLALLAITSGKVHVQSMRSREIRTRLFILFLVSDGIEERLFFVVVVDRQRV